MRSPRTSPAPSASRSGRCCTANATGGGWPSATTARGIRRCGCIASAKPATGAASPGSCSATSLQNLHERSRAQLVQREAGRQGLVFRQRAAVDAADEIVEQALPGRGVVEDIADQRGLSRLLHEIAQPFGCGGEAFEEERID